MFWRLGRIDDSRPVAAVVWLKVVCRRPSAGSIRSGSGSEVGVQELRLLAPLLDDVDDRMQVADLREHPRVGRVAGLALAVGGQAEPLEEHLAELLRASRSRTGRRRARGSAPRAPRPGRPAWRRSRRGGRCRPDADRLHRARAPGRAAARCSRRGRSARARRARGERAGAAARAGRGRAHERRRLLVRPDLDGQRRTPRRDRRSRSRSGPGRAGTRRARCRPPARAPGASGRG